jgi:hypothetical protein
MEYDEFIASYQSGRLRLGVDRLRIHRIVGHPLYEHLFASHDHPRLLNRLASVSSILIIFCLVAATVLPFLTRWWSFLPSLGLAYLFSRIRSRCQREGVRQLALADSQAYRLLSLEGVIVVDQLPVGNPRS